MIKVAICEDERALAVQSKIHLVELGEKYEIDMTIEVYSKSMTLLKDINKKNIKYDILLLDIEMDFMNGIELAKHIRSKDKQVVIIYVSSYDNYAIDAFSVQPYQFIVKPIDWQLYDKYFLQVVDNITNSKTFYHYTFNKVHYKKMISDIQYFHSNRRIIHMIDKEGNDDKFSDKMNHVELVIKEGKHKFLRIHQSYLINYDYISAFSLNSVTMIDGKIFSISPDRSKTVASEYTKFISARR